MTRINEGFFGRRALWTVGFEIILTFHISRSLGPINSGLNSTEVLCFFFVSDLITEQSLALVLITE